MNSISTFITFDVHSFILTFHSFGFRFSCPVALHPVFPRNVVLWHLFLISLWNSFPRGPDVSAALPSIRKAYPYILVLSWMYSVSVQYYQAMHFCVRLQSTTNVRTACDSAYACPASYHSWRKGGPRKLASSAAAPWSATSSFTTFPIYSLQVHIDTSCMGLCLT